MLAVVGTQFTLLLSCVGVHLISFWESIPVYILGVSLKGAKNVTTKDFLSSLDESISWEVIWFGASTNSVIYFRELLGKGKSVVWLFWVILPSFNL